MKNIPIAILLASVGYGSDEEVGEKPSDKEPLEQHEACEGQEEGLTVPQIGLAVELAIQDLNFAFLAAVIACCPDLEPSARVDFLGVSADKHSPLLVIEDPVAPARAAEDSLCYTLSFEDDTVKACIATARAERNQEIAAITTKADQQLAALAANCASD